MPSIFGDHMVIQESQGIQVWGWADAGDEVSVSLSKRTATTRTDQSGRWSVAVRYGWADDPRCMLFDGAGFPVSPFRTDDWPGVTVDKNLVF